MSDCALPQNEAVQSVEAVPRLSSSPVADPRTSGMSTTRELVSRAALPVALETY